MLNIIEDETAGTVTVNGLTFDGFVDDEQHSCGHLRIYWDVFDAYCCPSCNEWLKRRCGDNACGYCAGRPERPFEGAR